MKYVVTTVWKHPVRNDWRATHQIMSKANDKTHVAEINWEEIDETTHGSFAIYHSKEPYYANPAFMREHRSNSISERDIEMLREAHCESHVDFTSL